jgi:multicomponent Na+:H+ antiporter subunit D
VIEHHLPILLVAVPLVAAPLCAVIGSRQITQGLALVVCWLTFGMSVWLLANVMNSGPLSYELGGWHAPYGIVYIVDYLSAFVMLFVSAMAAFVLTWSPSSIQDEIPPSRHYLFYTTYLLCVAGLLGICITGDLFNVFVFLEISSLSSYALISLGRSRRAPLAAFQYLVMGTIGATFILIGIGLLYQMTGTLNMADMAAELEKVREVDGGTWAGTRTMLVCFAFLTVGLCIKMAVFPLHSWLPNAYTYAPSAVTSFIAATSTKVSVYVLIRLVFGILTPRFAFEWLPLDTALMAFSLFGIFAASLAAIYQSSVKRLLAFSSIAQIGYMLLGISMATTGGLTAGIVHMFNHALIKGGLFMAVGCFVLRIGTASLEDLRGAGKTMPWTSFAWALGGLGLIGVPVTAGFVSKWLLLTAAIQSGYWWVATLMLLSSLLALVYVWRVVETLYFAEPSQRARQAREAPPLMLLLTYLVIGASIVFGVWTDYSAGIAALTASELLGATP